MYGLIAVIVLIILLIWYVYNLYSHKLYNVSQVILFYRPGCPWCDLFKSEWSIIEKKLGDKAKKINTASDSSGLSRKFDVQGVPTIMFFDDQGNYEKYNGTRTATAILDELSRRSK